MVSKERLRIANTTQLDRCEAQRGFGGWALDEPEPAGWWAAAELGSGPGDLLVNYYQVFLVPHSASYALPVMTRNDAIFKLFDLIDN
jgi:hypothetical protein